MLSGKQKKQKEQEKIVETQKFREAYRSETKEAAMFQAEAERQRRELLALKNQEMLNFQRTKVEHMHAAQKERINATMNESLFKFEVFRAHKKDLKEAEERRRRMSVDVRTKIRAENKKALNSNGLPRRTLTNTKNSASRRDEIALHSATKKVENTVKSWIA